MWCYASFLVFAQMLLAGSALAQGAGQDRRIALIIGNSAYRQSPLTNPVNDAQAMAATLGSLGFTVTKLENASKGQMSDAIRKFGEAIKRGGVGLIATVVSVFAVPSIAYFEVFLSVHTVSVPAELPQMPCAHDNSMALVCP